jgi:1,5-anhydro-D-fructose reductase (1,5-anhydro-D-mannitol-forming)
MAPSIASQPDSVVAAVAGTDAARVERYARDVGVPTVHASAKQLLADTDIDVVYISTTNEHHEALTIAAAERGKHVLCEKPLALSLPGAQAMLEACRAAGVVLGTNHHLRNAATHRAIRSLIEQGAIGMPLAARVFHAVHLPSHLQGWRIDRPEAGGGVILDITVHDADTLRFVLNDEVETVTAMSASQGMGQQGLEDAVMGVMRFKSGLLAQFHDAFTIRHAATGFEVLGTEGSLLARDVMTQRPIGEIALRRGDEQESIAVEHENLYERSVRRFNAAVRGEGEPAATGLDGYRSLAIALAAREAALTGCAVAVSTL